MIDWYILEPDHTIRKAVSQEEASTFLADMNNKILVQTFGAGGRFVSTVFLGLDHSWMGGPPLVFETMIFEKGWLTKKRKPINWKKPKMAELRPNERTAIHDWQDRYSTWDEAIAGHVYALALLQREFPGNVYANKRRRRALQAAFIRRVADVPDVLPAVIVHELGAFS